MARSEDLVIFCDKLGFVGMNAKCKTQNAKCWNCVANYRYNSFGVS